MFFVMTKLTFALVVVLFDETLTNLIDLSYSVPKPPFGANLVLISSLVLELLITHNKEGMGFKRKKKIFKNRHTSYYFSTCSTYF